MKMTMEHWWHDVDMGKRKYSVKPPILSRTVCLLCMGRIGCPETLLNDYQHTQRNNPEERRHQ